MTANKQDADHLHVSTQAHEADTALQENDFLSDKPASFC